MSRTVVITSKHALGIEGAKQNITERFAVLKSTYVDKIGSADLRWTGNVAHIDAKSLGQKVTGEIVVDEAMIRIEIHLPWLLGGMAGMIQSILESNADALKPKAA